MRTLPTIMFVLIASVAFTDTWHVDNATGNDSNPGSLASPFATIQKGLNTVSDGDTLYIKGGTDYTDDNSSDSIATLVTAGTIGNSIVVEGYTTTPGDGTFSDVTLDASDNALTNCLTWTGISSNVYYVFKYLRFTGASAQGVHLRGPLNFRFIGCRADNNGGVGFNTQRNDSWVGCQADNNGGAGYFVDSGALFYYCISFINSAQGIRATGGIAYLCVSYENSSTQIQVSGSGAALACTVDGNNSQAGFSVGSAGNCIVYDCTNGFSWSAATSDTLEMSFSHLYFSNTTNAADGPLGIDSVTGSDPLFTGANDYTLQSSSPAIGAGKDASSVTGDTENMDIGAHQATISGASTVIVIDD